MSRKKKSAHAKSRPARSGKTKSAASSASAASNSRRKKAAPATAKKKKSSAPQIKKKAAKKAPPKKVAAKRVKHRITPEGRKLKEKDLKHVSATPDSGVYKRGGKVRDILDRKSVTGEVRYISPTTGKVLKRVTKGQKVLYGYVRDGKVEVLHPHPQTKDEKLRRWVEKHIEKSGDKAFALYEQRGRELARDAKGRPVKTKSGRNQRVSKLAIPSTVRQQRAVLYRKGRRVRNVEFAFHRHSKEELLSRLIIQPVKPTGRVVELNLMGETITDSLRSLVLDKSLKRLKKWERIFFEWVLIYRDPETGEKVTVPGYGTEDIPFGLKRVTAKESDPLHPYFFREKLSRVASLAAHLGHNIRVGLAHRGLRFTSLKKMTDLQNIYAKAVIRAEKRGNDNLAGKIQGILDRIQRPWFRGPVADSLTPIFAEDKNGARKRTALDKDRVRIKVRFTIEEDLAAKRAIESRKKPRKKRKGRK